ncbi:MAG TPA: hypothetical protein VFQ35_11415, partial [Polyangiaceae bacterium]|nr:hypothetical protein [Polyangiaceae bacterium]
EAWRFSRNEHRLATLSKSGLVVWDTESGNKWGISAPPGLGRVRSLDFANDDEVVVLRQANGDAIAFRYASNERVPPPALAFEDGAAVQWSLASHFLSAFRRSDGAWLGAVGLLGGGSSGVVVSAGGELDFIGAEPVPQPRCAFGNVLAAWPVCSDTQLVPGLLKRLLRDAGPR